jgi:tRNA (mo5U34)-methyltransferase
MSLSSTDEIRRRVETCRRWYHQIELAPGVVTPGGHNSPEGLKILDELGLPDNLSGKRVLDIGARDGFFSFAMEKRGGEVVAVDYAKPSVTGFGIAAEILASRVPYHVENVYALTPETYGMFDVVLFLGLIYHLRNPLLALDTVRKLCKPNALLFVESQLMEERLTGMMDRTRRLWSVLRGRREQPTTIPLWRLVPGRSLANDGTNCWVPTMPGLEAALQECEFTVLGSWQRDLRGCVAARACSNTETAHFRDLDSSVGMFQRERDRDAD